MLFAREYASWHQFFEDLPVSTNDFYKVISDGIATRQVPETTVGQIELFERGPLSARRAYLQIQRDWMTYHVCVASFGTGFFVSSRLLTRPFRTWPVIAVIFFLGQLLLLGVAIATYMVYDNAFFGSFVGLSLVCPGIANVSQR